MNGWRSQRRERWDLTTVDGVNKTVSEKELKVIDQSHRRRGMKTWVNGGGG